MKMRSLGLSSLDRTIARQRARVKQLQEGDANTAYFHLIARGRKRRNFITSLNVHGHLAADHDGWKLRSTHISKECSTTKKTFVAMGLFFFCSW